MLGHAAGEYGEKRRPCATTACTLVCLARAKAGDTVVTTSSPGTTTRGFAAANAPTVAVCLLPGTELAFESDVEWRRPFFGLFQRRTPCGRLARFRQLNMDHAARHHDALEFSNGRIVLLTDLHSRQQATVLQLPVGAQTGRDNRPARSVTTIDAEPVRTHEVGHP